MQLGFSPRAALLSRSPLCFVVDDHKIEWVDVKSTLTNSAVHLFCLVYFFVLNILYSISFFMPVSFADDFL
jgi:hypothetical protein